MYSGSSQSDAKEPRQTTDAQLTSRDRNSLAIAIASDSSPSPAVVSSPPTSPPTPPRGSESRRPSEAPNCGAVLLAGTERQSKRGRGQEGGRIRLPDAIQIGLRRVVRASRGTTRNPVRDRVGTRRHARRWGVAPLNLNLNLNVGAAIAMDGFVVNAWVVVIVGGGGVVVGPVICIGGISTRPRRSSI